jgi:hypothetical protein
MLTALPNAGGVVALDGSNVDIVNNVATTQVITKDVNNNYVCTVTLTEGNARATLPSSPTVNYFDVTPDSSKALITTSNSTMYIVNISNGAVTAVTPGAGATSLYQGGSVNDSSLFYVGGSDGTVHKIDLSSGTDTQQIGVNLKDVNGNNTSPNLVQVRNK